MEILIFLLIIIIIYYGFYSLLASFFRKKEDVDKIIESAKKGYNNPGELFVAMPELSPKVIKKVFRGGKQTAKEIKDAPFVSIKTDTIDIRFSKSCNPSSLPRFTKFIGVTLYNRQAIATPAIRLIDSAVDGDPYFLRYRLAEPKSFIAYGVGALSKVKASIFEFLDKIRNEEWSMFFGETFDISQDISSQIVLPLLKSPHTLVIGGTGSGKTTTIKSLVYHLAKLYPNNMKAYFACGKGSQDYNRLAKKLSSLPVAWPAKGQDVMVNLAEMLLVDITAEWQRRVSLFRDAGVSSFVEYNRKQKREEDKIGPLLFVLDEFAAWASISPISPGEGFNVEGSIWDTLRRLLAEGRSYGIVIIIGSQKATAELPTAYRTNLNQWLVHLSKIQELNNIDIPAEVLTKLKQGQFIFKKEGFYDSDKNDSILACMPFLDNDDLIDELDFITPEKREFAEVLIYPSGAKSGKETVDDQSRYFREFLIRPAGWQIEEENPPTKSFTAFLLKKNDVKLHLSFVPTADIHEEAFFDRFSRYIGQNYQNYQKVVFGFGSSTATKVTKLRESFENNGCSLIFEEDFKMIFNEARDLYFRKERNEKFDQLLNMYSIKPKKIMSPQAIKSPINKIELTKEYLDKLMKMKATSDNQIEQKGELFERFLKELFTSAGYWAAISSDLFMMKYREKPEKGDGGLDLLLVPRPQREDGSLEEVDIFNLPQELLDRRIAVQAKNYNKTNLGNEIISHLLKSSELYAGPSGQEIRELWLVHTNGTLSSSFRQEMDEINARGKYKLKVFNMRDIVELLPKQINQSDRDRIVFSSLSLEEARKELLKIGIVATRQTISRWRKKEVRNEED